MIQVGPYFKITSYFKMIYCGTKIESMTKNNDCLKKGIGVGLLGNGGVGDIGSRDVYCGLDDDVSNASPYDCFEKGVNIGVVKREAGEYAKGVSQLRENFNMTSSSVDLQLQLIMTLFVTLIVFGVMYVFVSWAWALIVSMVIGVLFWVYCEPTTLS